MSFAYLKKSLKVSVSRISLCLEQTPPIHYKLDSSELIVITPLPPLELNELIVVG